VAHCVVDHAAGAGTFPGSSSLTKEISSTPRVAAANNYLGLAVTGLLHEDERDRWREASEHAVTDLFPGSSINRSEDRRSLRSALGAAF
jgi:hypothetical protein